MYPGFKTSRPCRMSTRVSSPQRRGPAIERARARGQEARLSPRAAMSTETMANCSRVTPNRLRARQAASDFGVDAACGVIHQRLTPRHPAVLPRAGAARAHQATPMVLGARCG